MGCRSRGVGALDMDMDMDMDEQMKRMVMWEKKILQLALRSLMIIIYS